MRAPKRYTAKDGTVTWRVRYRNSAGRDRSRTFIEKRDADWFAETIDTHGATFANKALDDLEADAHPADGPTLDAVFAEFIEWKERYVRSPRTIADYRRHYQDSISPTLGGEPVDAITPNHISDWLDELVAGHIRSPRTGKTLSPKTIGGRHSLLHSIMEYAADPRRRYVTGNPCAGATLPKRLRPTPKGLMPAEWQALSIALQQIDPDAADLAEFLINSGFRWGEASALAPMAIEDYGDSMHVSMMSVTRRGPDGFYTVEPGGKAQKSMRRIRLDPQTAAIIRRRAIGKAPADLIFTKSDGEPWSYNAFRRRFNRAIKTAALSRQPTIHWLRHTHVAWMAMSGAPLPELQARVGHASITTTIGTYGSMISDVGDETMARFAQIRSSQPTALGPITSRD